MGYFTVGYISDSGTWQWGLIFGSGTRLYVTDNQIKKPNVTVYPVSKPQLNGKRVLLCLARHMFPDLVKFSWKREKSNGQLEDVPIDEGERLELREPGQMTGMIVIDTEKASTFKHHCYVKHEGGTVEAEISKAEPSVAPTTPWINTTTDFIFLSLCSMNLASLVYTVMILKSIVYCCGFSLLLVHRNKARRPSTSRHIH